MKSLTLFTLILLGISLTAQASDFFNQLNLLSAGPDLNLLSSTEGTQQEDGDHHQYSLPLLEDLQIPLEELPLTLSSSHPLVSTSLADKAPSPSQPSNKTSTTTNRFPCTFKGCPKVFTKNSRLVAHLRTHTGEKPFACDMCDMTFAERSGVKKHAKTHDRNRVKSFVCDLCEKSFFNQKALRDHQLTHSDQAPLSCPKEGCTGTFKFPQNLQRHLETVHLASDQKLSCHICGNLFKHQTYLDQHLNIHNGTFRCEPCKSNFPRKDKLEAHKKTNTHLTQLTLSQNPLS